MILVDSSVWIDYFRGARTPQVALLDSLLGRRRLAIGDLIAAEVLHGVRHDHDDRRVLQAFDAFVPIELCGDALALKASRNDRVLRAKGITVRKTIDTLIATRCIEDGMTLLHANRDFEPFSEHLGLRRCEGIRHARSYRAKAPARRSESSP